MDHPQLPSNACCHVRQRSHWNLAMLAHGLDSVTFRDWTMRRKCLMFIPSKPNGVTAMFNLPYLFAAMGLSMVIGLSLAVILWSLLNGTGFMVFDSNRKVGGIRFIKIGRLNLSISLSRK